MNLQHVVTETSLLAAAATTTTNNSTTTTTTTGWAAPTQQTYSSCSIFWMWAADKLSLLDF